MYQLYEDIENIIFDYIKIENLLKIRQTSSIYNKRILCLINKKRQKHVLSVGWVSYWREYVKEKTIATTIRNNSEYINEAIKGICDCDLDGCKKSPCDFIKKSITVGIKMGDNNDIIMWFLVHGMENRAIEIIKNNYMDIPSKIRQTINKYIKIGCYIKIAEYLNINYGQNYNDSYSYFDECDLNFNYYLYKICNNFSSKSMYINTINSIIIKNNSIVKDNPQKIIEILNNIRHKI